MSLQDSLQYKNTFTLVLDRSHVIAFQESFWKLMNMLDNYEIPWFNEAPASDHYMCWRLLSQIWKEDPHQVTLTFESRGRWVKEWNEEEEKMEEFEKDVYGFMFNRLDTSGPIYTNKDLDTVSMPNLDLSALLNRW